MKKLRPLIYEDASAWTGATARRVALIGMSGLGKTYLSNLLRNSGDWFHYSVDYRIGTRYMGEHIVDDFKRHAMKLPALAELLMTDSIYIGSNITFSNLTPLAAFLGKPGDPGAGGIAFEEYMRRQALHREAEIAASIDAVRFMARAEDIYGYPHFVADTSGSICEVVDPHDPEDPVLTALAENALIIWIRGDDAHFELLCERFDAAPKPMYSRPATMQKRWRAYLDETGLAEADVNPDAFIRWSFRGMLQERLPRYQAIADNWGITVPVDAFSSVNSAEEFVNVVADHLG